MGGNENRRARESCAAENCAVEKSADEKRGDSGEEDKLAVDDDDDELLRWLIAEVLCVGAVDMACKCFCNASCWLCSKRYF